VVHCAAVSGFGIAPDFWEIVNVRGTEHVIEACRAAGVRRLVHLSTMVVHEPLRGVVIDENGPYVADPGGPGYTASKIAAERLVLAAAPDLLVVVLRPGVVYGPRDRAALPRIVTQLAARRFLFVAGGRYRCHLVYVENLADAVVASLECTTAAGPYLVIDDPAVEVREFVCGIADGLGLPRPTLSLPEVLASSRMRLPRPLRWDIRRYGMPIFARDLRFSAERAQRELGYRSSIPYVEGMARLVAWAQADHASKVGSAHSPRSPMGEKSTHG
jgi:nucleoside-diphosphate-sugar epimerase